MIFLTSLLHLFCSEPGLAFWKISSKLGFAELISCRLSLLFRVNKDIKMNKNTGGHHLSLRSPSYQANSPFFRPFFPEPDVLDAELAALGSLGFAGCLSGVRFNSISPLKAALLHPDGSVAVAGPLTPSSCGTSSPASPYAAETTHSLSGTRRYYTHTVSMAPYLAVCGDLSAVLLLFFGPFIRLFMGPLTILLGKQTE